MKKGSTHNVRGDMNRLSPRLNIGLTGLPEEDIQLIVRRFGSLELIERGRLLAQLIRNDEVGHAVRKY